MEANTTNRQKLINAGYITEPDVTERSFVDDLVQDVPDVVKRLLTKIRTEVNQPMTITIQYDAPGVTVDLTHGDRTGHGEHDGMNVAEAVYEAAVDLFNL